MRRGGRGGVLGTLVAVMLLRVRHSVFNLLGLGSLSDDGYRLIDHYAGREK